MAATKKQKALLKKLKKQVRVLQRKEEQARNKLSSALKKMRKLGRTYKSKLASKVRLIKGKIAEIQSTTYAKVASDLERQLLKGIEAKGKALRTAIMKLEKKHIAKLKKGVAKKGKKVGKKRKVKKTVPTKKRKVQRMRRRRRK